MTENDTKDYDENVGKLARDLQLQDDQKINPIDLQREIQKGNNSDDSYESHLIQCLERGKQSMEGPFFVVVLFKKERIMQNVVRNYFFFRHTCPTPEYDQTVYWFDPKTEELRYLWSVPDKKTAYEIYLSRHELPAEYEELGRFCQEFIDGVLDRKCAELNGEEWEG